MANTTFTGAVRFVNGFRVVSKDASMQLALFQLDSSGLVVTPVLLTDPTNPAADHGSRTVVVPAVTADRTLTPPSPERRGNNLSSSRRCR